MLTIFITGVKHIVETLFLFIRQHTMGFCEANLSASGNTCKEQFRKAPVTGKYILKTRRWSYYIQ